MNGKMILYMLGKIIQLEAVLMTTGLICSVCYGEQKIFQSFLITILAAAFVGTLLNFAGKTKDKTIYAKEGFVITALAWITMSVVGAVPFVISGEIPNFVDAFFEIVSGFTTTGSSILTDVESMPKGLLFWRSFTHWVGGMGVLVLVMAILPSQSGRSMHILRAEMPGPVIGKLVPKVKSTAKVLYLIYIGFTVAEVVFLLFGGMNLFESLVHTFGTAGTGGFGIKADSVGSYSPYCQWVITIFMLIFGVNFNLYYLILLRKIKSVLKSEELWTYILIVLCATTLISINVFGTMEKMATVSDTVRTAAFQVASIITTTGYATVNFDLWPALSKIIMFMLMFIGGCAGSTAGGIKISRVIMLFKQAKANLKHSIHPRSVDTVRFESKTLEKDTVTGVTNYLIIYVICLVSVLLLISFDNFSAIAGANAPFSAFETHISAAVTCFNNVGPGFAAVGPSLSFSEYSDFSKVVLSFAMLLGRLEIYPILLLFAPSVWRKKKKA